MEFKYFELDAELNGITPPSFEEALLIVEAILGSQRFANSFKEIFPTITAKSVVSYLTAQNIVITRIRNAGCQDCYGAGWRTEAPNSIFLNSLMLLEMRDVERELQNVLDTCANELDKFEPPKKKAAHTKATASKYQALEETKDKAEGALRTQQEKHILFLMSKLIHEISHLINHACNDVFKGRKPVKKTPVKNFDNVQYDDFGDMMEKVFFGCVVEHKQSPSTNAFAISEVIGYPYKGAVKGFVVDPSENEAIFDLTTVAAVHKKKRTNTLTLKFVLSNVEFKNKSTGNRGHLIGFCPSSDTTDVDEAVMVGSDDEVEEMDCLAGKLFTPHKGVNGGFRS